MSSEALSRIHDRVDGRRARTAAAPPAQSAPPAQVVIHAPPPQAAPPAPPPQAPPDPAADPDLGSRVDDLEKAYADLDGRLAALEGAAIDQALSEMDTWGQPGQYASLPPTTAGAEEPVVVPRIMSDGRVVDEDEQAHAAAAAAVTKSEGKDGDFPASDYAYVPSAFKPSTWKLRLTAKPGGEPDAKIVGAAAAALSSGGFRGQKVDIPEGDLAAVKSKVAAAWKKANPDKKPAEMPDQLKSKA